MEKGNLIKVFAGAESSVILLKNRLEEIGVECIIKNDSPDAFLGTAPQVVDLYVNKRDLGKAKPIIQTISKMD
jgi:hypothetical protein